MSGITIDREALVWGLFAGGGAAGGWLLVAALVRRARRLAPVGGALVAVAFLAGWSLRGELPAGLAAGTGLLAVVGLLRAVIRPAHAFVGVVTGALVLGLLGLPDRSPDWAPWAVAAAVAVIGWSMHARSGVARSEGLDGERRLEAFLFAGSAAGVFVGVPDVEAALVLLAAATVVALLSWPLRVAVLGPACSLPAAAVLVWAAAAGAGNREAAFVGILGVAGLLVADPVGWWLRGALSRRRAGAEGGGDGRRAVVPLVVHAALVAVAGRVASHQTDVVLAAAIAGAVVAVGIAYATLFPMVRRSRRAGVAP
ncbi:MAG: hypothetical protein HY658_09330 [Actinobacteria bacterium]|nr:hypothetical protein [Actinomycetota bacterium]